MFSSGLFIPTAVDCSFVCLCNTLFDGVLFVSFGEHVYAFPVGIYAATELDHRVLQTFYIIRY